MCTYVIMTYVCVLCTCEVSLTYVSVLCVLCVLDCTGSHGVSVQTLPAVHSMVVHVVVHVVPVTSILLQVLHKTNVTFDFTSLENAEIKMFDVKTDHFFNKRSMHLSVLFWFN